MRAVTKVVNMLKDKVTIQQMSEELFKELFTYKEYEEVLKMSKWFSIDEKCGN
jgi:hypothetical protein